MKNVRGATHILILLAVFGIAGCDTSLQPFESIQSVPSEKRFFDWTVTGDAPVHVEWSFQSHQYGQQVRLFDEDSTYDSTHCILAGGEKIDWAKKGSSFRLYAISKLPNGHVWAEISVTDDMGNRLLYQSKENEGGAVELEGTVP